MDPMLVGNFSQSISVLLIRKYLWSNASSDYVCPASFLWFPFSVCTVSLPLITESQIRTMVKDHTVNVYVVYACVSHFHETRIKMFEWSCLSRNAMRCLVDIGVPAIVINEKKTRTSYRMSVVEQRKKGIKQTFMYIHTLALCVCVWCEKQRMTSDSTNVKHTHRRVAINIGIIKLFFLIYIKINTEREKIKMNK